MTPKTPEADEYNYFDEYWRCGRDGCGQTAGWGTDHLGVGACKLHGGASLRGEENPNFKHGLWSDYITYDEDVVEAVDTLEHDVEVLEELRNERLALYYQTLKHLAGNEGTEVAMDILDKIDAGQEVDAELVGKLARVIGTSSQSMDRLIARIQSLSNDIAELRGERPEVFEVEHTVGDESFEDLKKSIEEVYGEK